MDTRNTADTAFAPRNIRNYASVAVINICLRGLAYTMIDSYFIYFYTEFLGISAAAMATILTIGIMLDGVSDVVMGAVLDRVITRMGKARHWLLWMGVPCAASMLLIFLAPQNASATTKIIYAAITYNVYCCFMTTIRIPSQAMGSLGSDDDKTRALFGWFSSGGSNLAGVVTAATLVTLVQHFGGETVHAYQMTQLVLCIVTGIVIVVCGFTFSEKHSGAEWKAVLEQRAKEKALKGKSGEKALSTREQFYYIFRNKYWWIYLILHFFEACVDGCFSGGMAYYAKYVLQDTTAVAGLLAIVSTAQLIGLFADLPLLKITESLNVARIGAMLMVIGAGISFFGIGSPMTALKVGIAVRQFGKGMFNGMRGAMIPRIVDYGEWKFDLRQDGMAQAGNSVMQKVSSSFVTVLIGVLLTMTGYVGGAESIPQAATSAISFIFLGLPFFMAIGCFVFFNLFKLPDSRIKEMREEITRRHEANNQE